MSDLSYATDDVTLLMKKTALWTRIVSIFLLLGLAILFLGGIVVTIIGFTAMRHRDAPPVIVAGIAYSLSSLLYIMPTLFLSQYASRAKAYSRNPDPLILSRALRAQKAFWQYVAILMITITALNLIAIPVITIIALLNNR